MHMEHEHILFRMSILLTLSVYLLVNSSSLFRRKCQSSILLQLALFVVEDVAHM